MARPPRELNHRESFIARFLCAEWKVALLIPAGALAGWLYESGVWRLLP